MWEENDVGQAGTPGGGRDGEGRSLTRSLEDIGLSPRQAEILHCLAAGLSQEDIATQLGIAVGTVGAHWRRLYDKLGAGNRVEAVVRAAGIGLIHLPEAGNTGA
jgi:DNA-binding CsgD family transcriptional regulator